MSPVRSLVRLLPTVSRGLTAGLASLVAAQVAVSAGFVVALGAFIDGAVAAVGGDPDGARASAAFCTLAGLFMLDQVLDPVRELVAGRLGRAVAAALSQATVDGALRPAGIGHLDDSAVADRIAWSRGVGLGVFAPDRAVGALATVAVTRLGGFASVVVLGSVAGWLPALGLATAWFGTGQWHARRARRAGAARTGAASSLRRAAYLREAALAGPAVPELRIFGYDRWLVRRFGRLWGDGIAELRATGTTRGYLMGLGVLALAHVALLVPLASAVGAGELGPGGLAVAIQAAAGVAAVGWAGETQWILHVASEPVPHALAVAALGRDDPRPHRAVTAAVDRPGRVIRFERVTHRYPGAAAPVLDALDLEIPAGRTLAIVGANGAGKSTIVKLLGGLYPVQSGRITVDDVDLADLDLTAWRRQLAVVVQDFTRYPFPVRDNISVGCVEVPATDDALHRAVLRGGVGTPGTGWDTLLDRTHAGGAELSGGQWQRLALARGMYAIEHGARVLVLDEPTAHLDVRAERALHEHFVDVTAGTTTVLVSHRFATVRLADRIAVLHGGRVVEDGSHDELIARGGRYARMFAAQAEPFAEPFAEPETWEVHRG